MKSNKFSFKSFKIIHAVVILGIIALITNIFMGFVAYLDMSSLNNNIKDLYYNQLYKVKEVGYINGELGQLRNALTKIIDRPYNENTVNVVKSNDELIRKNMDNIAKVNLSPDEKELMNKLKENYENYMKGADEIISKRSKGEVLTAAFTDQYGQFGNNISAILTSLTNENIKSAENMYISSDKKFKSTNLEFLIIVIAIMLVVIFILLLITNIINKSIKDFSDILKVVAKGDFTVDIDKTSNNEFGKMKRELSITVESIGNILKGFKDNSLKINDQVLSLSAISEEMSSSASQVGEAVQEVAKGSEGQTNELIEITNIVSTFANSIDSIVEAIENVTGNAKDINNMAGDSNSQLTQLMNSLNEIQKAFENVSAKVSNLGSSIDRINEMTNLINAIADQTNLLALNAAIEAARAGEAGKGFAVVAEEIRKLAEQSKNSSQDITNVVNVISVETKEVISNTSLVSESFKEQENVVGNSMTSFKQIIEAINKVIPLINNVNDLITVLNKDKETIISKVENASAVSQENASAAEEIAASTDEMSASAEEVATSSTLLASVVHDSMEEIEKFKV